MSIPQRTRAALTGAASGVIIAFAFAALHHVLISDIWFSVIPMMVAGAACGACLAWSHALLFDAPSLRTWSMYNLAYVILFVGLGVASFLTYAPITTTAALLAADAPPGELIATAMPLTVAFTLASIVLISLLWGRTVRKAAAVTLTCIILALLFGLNISVIGLVELGGEGARLVGIFFGMIAAIIAGNAAITFVLQRHRPFRPAAAAPALGAPASAPALDGPAATADGGRPPAFLRVDAAGPGREE